MAVRAKFTCVEKRPVGDAAGTVEVRLRAVNRGDAGAPGGAEEDSVFGQYTPWGDVSMGIRNPTAAAAFERGRSYYVDFSPADGE